MVSEKKVLHHMMYEILAKEHWAYRSIDGALFAAHNQSNPIWILADKKKSTENINNALAALARECADKNLPITSVAAEIPLGRKFAEEYGAIPVRNVTLTAYYCSEPAKLTIQGHLTQPNHNDTNIIAEYITTFGKEVLGIEYSERKALSTADALIGTKQLYCWHDRTITGMCWIAGHYRDMAKLNYIFVPEHLRHNGYAKQLVSHVCAILVMKKKLPVLYTESGNIKANNLYRSLGFLPAGEIEMIHFGEPL